MSRLYNHEVFYKERKKEKEERKSRKKIKSVLYLHEKRKYKFIDLETTEGGLTLISPIKKQS